MIEAIEHIAIVAKDTAALARWYCDTLECTVIVEGKSRGTGENARQGIWFVRPPKGETMIEIVPANDSPRTDHDRKDAGLRHLAFTVTDIEAACAALSAKGVTFTGPSGEPGERRPRFILDLEGNLLQLVQRPEPLAS